MERLKVTLPIGFVSGLMLVREISLSIGIFELPATLVTKTIMQLTLIFTGYVIIHSIIALTMLYIVNSTIRAMVQSLIVPAVHIVLRFPLAVVDYNLCGALVYGMANTQHLPINDGSFSSSPFSLFAFTHTLRP